MGSEAQDRSRFEGTMPRKQPECKYNPFRMRPAAEEVLQKAPIAVQGTSLNAVVLLTLGALSFSTSDDLPSRNQTWNIPPKGMGLSSK